jgi:carboxypeptidase D
MLDRNKRVGRDPWNLKGLLIGNGWISGPDQYPSYLQFAYEHDLVKAGSKEATAIERQQNICLQDLSNGGKDKVDTGSCEQILQVLLQQTQNKENGKTMCLNMYDVRLKDTAPSCGMSWPPDLVDVTPYLRRQDVVQALHVNPDKKTGWVECNGAVGGAFTVPNSVPSIKMIPDLLAELPIILFSGDQDLICNHIGTEELINNMNFNGGKGFELNGVTAPRLDWVFEGEPAGIYQSARNLTYVKFYNSSHMVPFDYPRRTRDMLDRFMGVDIATVGGKPVDSIIGGEKSPQTSVGGHPNSTVAEEDQAQKLKDATYKAYYKSGEVAFVLVLIAALAWGFFIWRSRRRSSGYQGVLGGEPDEDRRRGGVPVVKAPNGRFSDRPRDIEAADFDEAELDDLVPEGSRKGKANGHDMEGERYSLGGDSEDDDDADLGKTGANGHK